MKCNLNETFFSTALPITPWRQSLLLLLLPLHCVCFPSCFKIIEFKRATPTRAASNTLNCFKLVQSSAIKSEYIQISSVLIYLFCFGLSGALLYLGPLHCSSQYPICKSGAGQIANQTDRQTHRYNFYVLYIQ